MFCCQDISLDINITCLLPRYRIKMSCVFIHINRITMLCLYIAQISMNASVIPVRTVQPVTTSPEDLRVNVWMATPVHSVRMVNKILYKIQTFLILIVAVVLFYICKSNFSLKFHICNITWCYDCLCLFS